MNAREWMLLVIRGLGFYLLLESISAAWNAVFFLFTVVDMIGDFNTRNVIEFCFGLFGSWSYFIVQLIVAWWFIRKAPNVIAK